jgi:YjbE family integral membrane protein
MPVSYFSSESLAALLAIVVIDLVLAGDNAVVIALASRGLPRHVQTRAIAWGAVGAIGVRSFLTVVVVGLLRIPGLLLAGGVLLVWIAYRLLRSENGERATVTSTTGFWGALRTIVVADVVMGLDNVLAVAGAAHGSYVLVVLGLAISVPIVVWGSTLMLRVMERYEATLYLGAGVLAWTAAKMMIAEPLWRAAFAANGPATALLEIAVVTGVLWAGFVKNHHRIASSITARLAAQADASTPGDRQFAFMQGEHAMRVLVPVDGSRNSDGAVRHVIREWRRSPGLEIHLLNVQATLSRYIARFIAKSARRAFHRDEGEKALHSAKKLLEQAGVRYHVHIRVGDRAAVIAAEAQHLDCHRIVMGTARKSSLTRMLEDSTTNKVLEQASVPVEVIAGEAVSKIESYGVALGLGSLLALLLGAAAL